VEIARVPEAPPRRQDRQARAFREATIPDHDVYLLSGNWAVFAAPRLRPNAWYCHTPVRVFYDLRESFLASLPPFRRWVARKWIERRQPEYETAVAGAERIIANSRNVASRVEQHLHRSAEVIYPPVDTSRYRFERVGETWLAVSRLSHEKRIDLLVETFRRLSRDRLLVVGGGQVGVDTDRFTRSLHPPSNVEFLGEVPESRLRDLYATCRGLIAASMDEDFGLTPVEAMASGKVVVAADEGGYRETIVPGETGWLVPPTPVAFADAIASVRAERLEGMRAACERRARAFDSRLFVERMRSVIAAVHAGIEADK